MRYTKLTARILAGLLALLLTVGICQPVLAQGMPNSTKPTSSAGKNSKTEETTEATEETTEETTEATEETTEETEETTEATEETTEATEETTEAAEETTEAVEEETEAEEEDTGLPSKAPDADPTRGDDPLTELNYPETKFVTNFDYSEDILFSGIYKTNKHFFQVPEYWDCKYIFAQIEVELSQLIQDVPASLTFLLNDLPITTYKMDYRNGKTQVFYVDIPLKYLKTGYNTLDITGYVRLYDDEGCIDDFSGANWISVRRTSYIQVGYDTMDPQCRISAYPYPFLSSTNESGSSTSILVSDKVDESELAAALMLRADLGSETKLEDKITLARVSDSTGNEEHRVVVSLQKNLTGSYLTAVQEALNGESLADKAMIRFLKDGDTDVLLITSESGEALTEAAMMLMDESRVSQEKTDVTFVRENASAGIRAQLGSSLAAGRMTLDSLLDSGLSFVGPFHQVGDIYLPFSGGYVLAESGMVDLKFRYSENLDFDRSVITVYWGNVPVSSKRLTLEKAGGDTLSFTMPEDVVGTYAGKISIAFDLELPDLFCTPRMEELAWAYVSEDSSFYLPVGVSSNYTLSQRPYPFEVSSRFNDLNVVIPENISAAELDTLGRVIALYGESPSPYGSLKVSRADSLKTKDDKNGNLIVIGTYNDNSLIQELNADLHFRYSDTGVSFQSNDFMVLSDSYAKDISTLQLMHSPYAEGRAVLVVAGLNDSTMLNLRSFLTRSENIWKLEKDTVLIDSEQSVRTFELAEKRADVSTPMLKKMLDTNREAAVFTLVSIAVMLLFLLAAILILIRIYWRQKK